MVIWYNIRHSHKWCHLYPHMKNLQNTTFELIINLYSMTMLFVTHQAPKPRELSTMETILCIRVEYFCFGNHIKGFYSSDRKGIGYSILSMTSNRTCQFITYSLRQFALALQLLTKQKKNYRSTKIKINEPAPRSSELESLLFPKFTIILLSPSLPHERKTKLQLRIPSCQWLYALHITGS